MPVSLKNGKTLTELMNVKVVGDGDEETIVLAHGFGGTQGQWNHVVQAILHHMNWCRVVLFDWPGACTTDPHDFDDAVPSIFDSKSTSLYHDFANLLITVLQEELHIDTCILVGHSMSAMIGCIAALDSPGLFKKLILVGASPRYLNDRDYYGGFEQEDLEQLFAAMEADYGRWAMSFAAAVVGTDADQEAIDAYARTLSSMRPEVAMAMAKAIFESDYRSMIEELMSKGCEGGYMPEVHVLQTSKDLAVPLLVSDYLKRHLVGSNSNGYLEILQTDGHVPQLSAPNVFCSALLRHLK